MAYNLEEQEQLESLKAFWNRYGNFIVTIVAVLALSIAGWRAWGWYQERQSTQASVVYEQLRQAAAAAASSPRSVSSCALRKELFTVGADARRLPASAEFHPFGQSDQTETTGGRIHRHRRSRREPVAHAQIHALLRIAGHPHPDDGRRSSVHLHVPVQHWPPRSHTRAVRLIRHTAGAGIVRLARSPVEPRPGGQGARR